MKNLFVILAISSFIVGCATQPRPARDPGDEAIAPTCKPSIGMSAEKFSYCACVRTLNNPTAGIKLISKSEDRQGIYEHFRCARPDGNLIVMFQNDVLMYIHSD